MAGPKIQVRVQMSSLRLIAYTYLTTKLKHWQVGCTITMVLINHITHEKRQSPLRNCIQLLQWCLGYWAFAHWCWRQALPTICLCGGLLLLLEMQTYIATAEQTWQTTLQCHHHLHLEEAWLLHLATASHTPVVAAGQSAPQVVQEQPALQSAGWGPCNPGWLTQVDLRCSNSWMPSQ